LLSARLVASQGTEPDVANDPFASQGGTIQAHPAWTLIYRMKKYQIREPGRNVMRGWICAVVLLAVFMVSGCTKHEEPAVEGKSAPDFTLNDLSGRPVQLSSLKGKVVLLNFWATWCPPCREEIPSMVRLNQSMQGKEFQMLAVSIDEGGKDAVVDFFKKGKVALPALLDTEGKVSRRYGTTGVPETFVIDRKGVILKKVVGSMDWSSPEVLAALNELIGKK
jgi:peroxiredoxin